MKQYGFSLSKKRVGIYLNSGETISWVQGDAEHQDSPDPKLVAAIEAARKAFFRVYTPKTTAVKKRAVAKTRQ